MKKIYLIIWLTISLFLTWCWNSQKIENNSKSNTWSKIENNINNNTTWNKINNNNNDGEEEALKIIDDLLK